MFGIFKRKNNSGPIDQPEPRLVDLLVDQLSGLIHNARYGHNLDWGFNKEEETVARYLVAESYKVADRNSLLPLMKQLMERFETRRDAEAKEILARWQAEKAAQ